MPDTTYEIRRSRKTYVCTEASYHTIRPGDHYLYGACPPWHEMNESGKWWTIRACLRCADRFGLHTSGTRKRAEALALGEKRL